VCVCACVRVRVCVCACVRVRVCVCACVRRVLDWTCASSLPSHRAGTLSRAREIYGTPSSIPAPLRPDHMLSLLGVPHTRTPQQHQVAMTPLMGDTFVGRSNSDHAFTKLVRPLLRASVVVGERFVQCCGRSGNEAPGPASGASSASSLVGTFAALLTVLRTMAVVIRQAPLRFVRCVAPDDTTSSSSGYSSRSSSASSSPSSSLPSSLSSLADESLFELVVRAVGVYEEVLKLACESVVSSTSGHPDTPSGQSDSRDVLVSSCPSSNTSQPS